MFGNTSFSNMSTNNSIEFTPEPAEVFSPHLIAAAKITYSFIFVSGILSNIIACIGTFSHHPLLSLHMYILNLVVCDILILTLYVPTQVLLIKDQLEWKMGLEMCKVVNVVLPVTLCCTIGTLMAIAFDRTRALLKPFRWREDSKKLSKVIIPVIWIVSIFINYPLIKHPKLAQYNSEVHCIEGWHSRVEGEQFWISMFVLVYALPLVGLITTHIFMIVYIRRKSLGSTHEQNIKLMIMGAKLVSVFAVCTGFQHIFFFMTSTFSSTNMSMVDASILFVVSNGLVSVQACVNPFLYGSFTRTLRLSKKNIRKISHHVLSKFNDRYVKPDSLPTNGSVRILNSLSSATVRTLLETNDSKDEMKYLILNEFSSTHLSRQDNSEIVNGDNADLEEGRTLISQNSCCELPEQDVSTENDDGGIIILKSVQKNETAL